MSTQIRTTKKSVIYTFDGYSESHRAYVQGAFTGTFIVPTEVAHLIPAGYELDKLRELHAGRRHRVILRNDGRVA